MKNVKNLFFASIILFIFFLIISPYLISFGKPGLLKFTLRFLILNPFESNLNDSTFIVFFYIYLNSFCWVLIAYWIGKILRTCRTLF
jgi:hypothetical protein